MIIVLDTNVLLTDPHAIYRLQADEIVIPSIVIQELDSKKRLMDELGMHARMFAKMLDSFCEEHNLCEGVILPNGSKLKVVDTPSAFRSTIYFDDDSNDTKIIKVCEFLRELDDVIFISKDVMARVKANIVGIKAEDYSIDWVVSETDERFHGTNEQHLDPDLINLLYQQKSFEQSMLPSVQPLPHQFFIFKSFDEKQSAIARFKDGRYHLIRNAADVWGVYAKNTGQRMAMDLLLDPSVQLVTIAGKAGTGKTLLALAAALKQTFDDHLYHRILVARPVVPMGKDIGYLPGDMDEKLRPWMQPIYDNLEFLFDCKDSTELNQKLAGYEQLIQVEALTYIRGRSIPGQFIIIDEAQNLSKHEVKTILTRVGEGSKIVLIGDPDQIDHPYLDPYSNGLTYATERLKHLTLTGHITLSKGERSTLAQMCADLL